MNGSHGLKCHNQFYDQKFARDSCDYLELVSGNQMLLSIK